METLFAILAVVVGPLGVVLGWWLNGKSTRKTIEDERAYQERQVVRERQEVAAEGLREAIIEIQGIAPQSTLTPDVAAAPLAAAHRRLREAWTRASLIRESGIDCCFYALDMALFIASQDVRTVASQPTASPLPINFWPLSVALTELRMALDADLQREPLPEPEFPSSKELIDLAGSDIQDPGIEKIRRYLMDHRIGV